MPSPDTQHYVVSSTLPWGFRYGCCIGYALYLLYFVSVDMQVMPLFFHNGGLLPIMVLIMFGAALGVDPIAKHLFQSRVGRFLGNLSYAQYLMQMPVFYFFVSFVDLESLPLDSLMRGPMKIFPGSVQLAFPVALVAVAAFVQRYVQRPFTEWQQWRSQRGVKGSAELVIARVDAMIDRCWCTTFPTSHASECSETGAGTSRLASEPAAPGV